MQRTAHNLVATHSARYWQRYGNLHSRRFAIFRDSMIRRKWFEKITNFKFSCDGSIANNRYSGTAKSMQSTSGHHLERKNFEGRSTVSLRLCTFQDQTIIAISGSTQNYPTMRFRLQHPLFGRLLSQTCATKLSCRNIPNPLYV